MKHKHEWSKDVKFLSEPKDDYDYVVVEETCLPCNMKRTRSATSEEINSRVRLIYCEDCDHLRSDHDSQSKNPCVRLLLTRIEKIERRLDCASLNV